MVRQRTIPTNELYDANVDNAFELLASLGQGVDRDDSLQLDLGFFRSVSKKAQEKMVELENMWKNIESWQKIPLENYGMKGKLNRSKNCFAPTL